MSITSIYIISPFYKNFSFSLLLSHHHVGWYEDKHYVLLISYDFVREKKNQVIRLFVGMSIHQKIVVINSSKI